MDKRLKLKSLNQHASVANARRDLLVLGVVIAAVLLLVWNGSSLFNADSFPSVASGHVHLTSTALMLNVALILFGWRRYVDLQHEAELRADGERRALIIASTDATTGLYNRKGFADNAQQLCATAASRCEHLVILSVQIHRLKAVSDRHGYEAGDELLRRMSASFKEFLPPDAIVGRLSGDEFAVALLLAPKRVGEAEKLGAILLASITRPFEIRNRMIQVGAFAGIAAAYASEVSIPDLLRRADIAMDHAKSGRVARAVWFDTGMERALVAHSEIEQGIRLGLDNDQFLPFYEPQVDLRTGQVVGFEVLARWNHPLSGIISPDVFIPVAEEVGLISRLSEQVMRIALLETAGWDPRINISVNISPTQLADGWLAQRIVQMLTDTGFPANRLVVEITESSLFADLDLARAIVLSLKNQGVRVALDDFGTGFSSLAHLRSLPFDVIKIDRSFIANIHTDRESAAIVKAVTTLANALDVPVTVEGIETAEAHASVIGHGCALGQGWYFGKPMTRDQALQMLLSQGNAADSHEVEVRQQRFAN